MKQDKKKLAISIKKAIGTLNKVVTMIQDDVYCADIGQQINASIGLLRSANTKLLKNHLACCGVENLSSGDNKKIENFINEFAKVRDMSVRK